MRAHVARIRGLDTDWIAFALILKRFSQSIRRQSPYQIIDPYLAFIGSVGPLGGWGDAITFKRFVGPASQTKASIAISRNPD